MAIQGMGPAALAELRSGRHEFPVAIQTRWRALLEFLGSLEARAMEVLRPLEQGTQWGYPNQHLERLLALGPRVVPVLIAYLDSRRGLGEAVSASSFAAAHALASLATAQDVPALVALLRSGQLRTLSALRRHRSAEIDEAVAEAITSFPTDLFVLQDSRIYADAPAVQRALIVKMREYALGEREGIGFSGAIADVLSTARAYDALPAVEGAVKVARHREDRWRLAVSALNLGSKEAFAVVLAELAVAEEGSYDGEELWRAAAKAVGIGQSEPGPTAGPAAVERLSSRWLALGDKIKFDRSKGEWVRERRDPGG